MNPESKDPQSKRAPWLVGSVACCGTALVLLGVIAFLPFDPESPLAQANMAIVTIFGGGLIASILAAVSVVRSDHLRSVAALWCLLLFLLAVFGWDALRIVPRLIISVFG